MKTNRILAGMLVVLGFGSAVGLGSGCVRRAQKSTAPTPAADSVAVQPGSSGDMPVRVMYGVQPTPFREVGTPPPAETPATN